VSVAPAPRRPLRPAMRLPLIPPADLTPEQRSLYDAMRKGIAGNFNAFKVEREDGALMGPWNPWLHEPGIGKAIWDLTLAMTANATLPDNIRQIAILLSLAHGSTRRMRFTRISRSPSVKE
jgi:4-carboxymuconolactone decarboxylase